jgi:hypothetical protein
MLTGGAKIPAAAAASSPTLAAVLAFAQFARGAAARRHRRACINDTATSPGGWF